MVKVEPITPLYVNKILASNKLTDAQKYQFIKENSAAIKSFSGEEINMTELKEIMKSRPLVRFRPIKNSFTKQGDKILLAKSLNIEPKEVNSYIANLTTSGLNTNTPVESIEKVKSYVYRHGTKGQVLKFLEYELSDVKFILERLYKTLQVNSGGLYDYYERPIHRMSNNNLAQLYNVIDKSLRNAEKKGAINKDQLSSTSEWALIKIYEIQNNSKLIRAYNKYKDLS